MIIKDGEKTLLYHRGIFNKIVVPYEEIFDLLHKSHTENTGHGGRNKMRNNLKEYMGVGEYVHV